MTSRVDPAALAERLLSAGVPREQALAHVDVLRDMLAAGVATRHDVASLASQDSVIAMAADVRALATEIDSVRSDIVEVRERLDGLRSGVRTDLDGLRQDMDARLQALAHALTKPKMGWGARITLWLVGLVALGGALGAAYVAGALAPEALVDFLSSAFAG